MNKYELYEDFFISVGTNGNADVILDFYEFLKVSKDASEDNIRLKCQAKKRVLEYGRDYNYIEAADYYKQLTVLNKIDSCLLHSPRNRQIYDERISKTKEKNMPIYKKFFNAIKRYKIERTNKEVKIKDANDFKKKIMKIIAVVAALGIFAGGTTAYVNNINDESVSDDPTTSASEFYTDADVKMETIEYLVESGSNVSNVADIAAQLGISKEKCIKVGNIKISGEGTIFEVSVPEDIAKKYNAEQEEKDKLKVKKHFVCEYKTPDDFDSLVDVAQDIVSDENFSGFKEGKEYTRDGRTPVYQLAKDMIRDNHDKGEDLQHAKSGTYKLYFYGTDEEYENFVKEGKLPQEIIKTIN